MKKATLLTLILCFLLILSACGTKNNISEEDNDVTADVENMNFTFTERDLSGSYDENNVTTINLDDNFPVVSGNGISVEENRLIISESGSYIFAGTLTNGSITVDAGNDDKVQIVLSGVSITNNDGPAIYIKNCKKAFITAVADTENTLNDGTSYSVTDDDSTLDGTVFSKADLTVNGKGSLTVNGNLKHGIVSKDDLVLTITDLIINSKNVALNGKDCVKIESGNYTLTAGSDAIRSDNTEDANRGFVYINNGNLTLNAGNDGIQAETLVKINYCNASLITGEGSQNASYNSYGEFNHNWGFAGNNSASTNATDESAKGIKCSGDIIINEGVFSIDSSDDSIHSNSSVYIENGSFSLSSGDDGIHADSSININNGTINISKSYEGIEATDITINNGEINIVSFDDGFNAAGGNDASSLNERPGQNMFSGTTGTLTFNGGYTVVNAEGDGLDSNGELTVTNGIILISGPTNGGNGALDYASTASVTGGTVIALGSAGMATNFNSAENQAVCLVAFNAQSANSTFAVCDENKRVITSFTTSKPYECAVVTTPEMQIGETYTLVGNAVVENTDKNGYTNSGMLTSGETLITVTPEANVYGFGNGTLIGGNAGGGPMDKMPDGSMSGRNPGGNQGGFGGGKPDKRF